MDGRITPHQVFEAIGKTAEAELERSWLGLGFSGLSAGLNIGFGFLAVAAVSGAVPPEYAHLVGALAYPIGFILVIVSRAQMFTEQTLTPVVLLLDRPTRENTVGTARLWVVVLAANLVGAFLFSGVVSAFDIPPRIEAVWLLETARQTYAGGWVDIFLRSTLAGWLVALLVWMLHTDSSTAADVLLTWIVAFVIHLAGVTHSVAGAVEVLYLAHENVIRYVDWLLDFQVPVTLGNALGGLIFVTLVNYAQVVGLGKDVERADRRQRKQRLEEKDHDERLESADEDVEGREARAERPGHGSGGEL